MPLSPYVSSALLATVCLLLVACTDNSTDGQADVNDTLTFVPCESSEALECGSFDVPLIHDSTDSRRISIDVARLPGIGDGPHEPLLINFGGPGSGIEVLQEFAESNAFPDSIREVYDIIGFEQRGVANPLRVDCDALGNIDTNPYPQDRADIQRLVDDYNMLADACSAEYADQIQWIGSNAVVRDMETMRQRLEAPKLNMVGSSFGTRITALYLDRYPNVSGRVVLDAPLRPSGSLDSLWIDTAVAQQRSFKQLLEACGTTVPDCDRATIEGAFVSRMNSLLDNADQNTAGAFFLLALIAIEESDNAELLAPLLIDFAINGDPTDMLALIDQFGLDEGDDEEDGKETNSSITLERAVLCADDSQRPTVDSLVAALEGMNEASDFFGEALLPITASCVGWPEALDSMDDIQTTDAPTALVIGGTGDVLTPIEWAEEMADAIGGVFISSDHLGHTTLLVRRNDCVESIVDEYLVNGTVPPAGTSCD